MTKTNTAKRFSIACLYLGLLCACSQNIPADDGLETGKDTAVITGEFEAISLEKLHTIGIKPYALDTGDNLIAYYFPVENEVYSRLSNDLASLSITVLDKSRNLVLTTPSLPLSNASFLIHADYTVRVVVGAREGFKFMQAGTGYYAELPLDKILVDQ